MAQRENQWLQIALLLFVIITVALGATSYIFFTGEQKTAKERDAAIEKERATANRLAANEAMVALLKRTIGAGTETDAALKTERARLKSNDLELWNELEKIEGTFNADMKRFADEKNYPPGNRNYRNLPEYLLSVTQTKNEAINERDQDIENKKKELAALKAQLASANKLNADNLAAVKADRTKIENAFTADRERMTASTKNLTSQISDKNKEFDKLSKESKQKIQELEIDLNKAVQLKDAFVAKVHKQESDTFESPDGRVTWVNQGQKIVWINLGPADGLRHQMTFSVFDKGETNVQEESAKGKIEVIRLIDRHLAAARILDDSIENPILPDDLIFSPSWHPGQRIHFALMGFMDIDGDGKNDRSRIRSMIELNGGIVDLEVLDDGTTAGPGMSIDTRYLVMGPKATEKTSPEMLRTITNIRGEADQLGVELLAFKKLLNQMGYTQEARVVELGKGADSSQFGPKQGARATSTGDTSSIFRKRRPPSSGY
ncbi:MAG: hypothetical protein NXI22_12430 [bacterium]|nr:hypothetical protein [bacterium]